MKNTYLSLFCIVILTLTSCNNHYNSKKENTNNDSIEKYLKLAEDFYFSYNKRDQFKGKALSYIDLNKGDTTALGYLFRVTQIDVKTNNLQEYKKNSLVHLEYSLKRKDTLNLARYYKLRGSQYKDKSIYDSAFFYYNKSEKFYIKIKNVDNELVHIYFNKSIIQNRFADYLGSDLNASKALTLSLKIKNYNLTYHILNNLGNINHNLKNYDKAIEYHQQAYKLLKKHNLITYNKNFNHLSCTYNNIGNSYREIGNYKKAIYYLANGLNEELKKNNDPEITAYIYNNLGYIYLKQKNYEDLPKLFEKASEIFERFQNYDECAISNMYLSDYYLQLNDTSRAVSFSEKALELAKRNKGSYYYLTVLSHAGSVNKEKASMYIKQYHKLNDSLLFQERKVRNQFYKIQLETNEITKEKETAIKQKWVVTSIITSFLLIVTLLFIVYIQRTKNKEFLLVQDQQKANESFYQLLLNQNTFIEKSKNIEKKRIAQELHDNILNKLASTRFNLFTISKKTDIETINNALVHVEKIKDIEDEIRNISHNLSTDVFSQSNTFNALLENLIIEQTQLQRVKIQLEIDETLNWDTVSSKIKMNLYRIIQEVLHNINKHSEALKGSITIVKDANNICMSIQDNGIGFNTAINKPGIGLKNIQERVFNTNGKITLQSSEASGTSFFIVFPM